MAQRKPMLPPFFFVLAAALMVLLNLFLPLGDFLPVSNMVGLVPLVLGVVVVLAADLQFKRAGTTIKPFQTSSALVTAGVFRFSRNPMYLSMVLLLIAFALFMGSVSPWLVIPVFVLVIQRRFITVEERMLEHTFGEDYLTYKKRVRRWI